MSGRRDGLARGPSGRRGVGREPRRRPRWRGKGAAPVVKALPPPQQSCADGSWASSLEASRATAERPWPPRAKPGSGLSSTPDPRPAGWSAADTPSPTRSGRSYPARLWSTDAPRRSWSIRPWTGRGRRRSASRCTSSRRPAVASGSARARSTGRPTTPSQRRSQGAGRRRRRWSARLAEAIVTPRRLLLAPWPTQPPRASSRPCL